MRLRRLVLLMPIALLAACGGEGGAAGPNPDLAACDSAYVNGGPAAVGDTSAAKKLLEDLGDAGPDDDYSEDVSGYMQILAADAQVMTSGGSARSMADHVDDAYAACTDIGWKAPE